MPAERREEGSTSSSSMRIENSILLQEHPSASLVITDSASSGFHIGRPLPQIEGIMLAQFSRLFKAYQVSAISYSAYASLPASFLSLPRR